MERTAGTFLLLALVASLASGCLTIAPFSSEELAPEWVRGIPKDWHAIHSLHPLLFNGARDVAATPAGPVVTDFPVGGKTTVGLVASGTVSWFRIFAAHQSALAALPDAGGSSHPQGLVAVALLSDGAVRVEALDAATGRTVWVREVSPIPPHGALFAQGQGDRLVLGFAPQHGPSVVAAADGRGDLVWRQTVPGTLVALSAHNGGAYALYSTRGTTLSPLASPTQLAEQQARIVRLDDEGAAVWERVVPPVEARRLSGAAAGLGFFVLADAPDGRLLRYDPQGYITHFRAAACPVRCLTVDAHGHGLVVSQDATRSSLSLVVDRLGTTLVVPTGGIRLEAVDGHHAERGGGGERIYAVGTVPGTGRGILVEVLSDRLLDRLAERGAKAALDEARLPAEPR